MHSFRHVLTPTDFSPCSSRAFTLGGAIARFCGARLTLLHVYPYTAPAGPETPYVPAGPTPDEETRARIVRELGRLSLSVPTPARAITLATRDGDASSEILAYAEAHDVDLIVIGAHGRRGLDRLIIGSVAQQVSRHAACSVLTVPGSMADLPISIPVPSNVLCAVDLTESSRHTLERAAAIARAAGATLTVHHAVQTPQADDPWPTRGRDGALRDALAESAREQLARLIAPHTDLEQKVELIVTFGWPREEIVRVATARAPGLLVLGAHSTTFVGRVLFGSTAEHVLRAMPCPVLLVRPTSDPGVRLPAQPTEVREAPLHRRPAKRSWS
jgi:nucleotide-binding universal stress UspA family protein